MFRHPSKEELHSTKANSTNTIKRKNPVFVKPIDVDKDDGGVYKARQKKNQDIKEVPDNDDMHLDLPVSRRVAEEIDDVFIFISL